MSAMKHVGPIVLVAILANGALCYSAEGDRMPDNGAPPPPPATLFIGSGAGDVGKGGYRVPISLTNTVRIKRLQFDLVDRPDDLQITGCNTTSRTPRFTITLEDQGSTTPLLIAGASGDAITTGSGPVAELVCRVKSTAAVGTRIQLVPRNVQVIDSADGSLLVSIRSGYFDVLHLTASRAWRLYR